MRFVVTGGAGFLGSHLCDRILREGGSVLCVDNLLTGRRANIAHLHGRPGFRFLEHDVTRPLMLQGEVDVVMHLASPASPVDYMRHAIHTMKVGGLGTYYMLGLARAKSARFVLASTSEVYGDPQQHPQREDYWGHVNPVGVRGVYDEAKRFAEAMTMAYHRTHGTDVKIARIFNTYGPRMRLSDGRAVCQFILQALKGEDLTIHGDGRQTRSFCYVDDLIEGLWRLVSSGETGPINLGNPHEISVLDLAETVIRLTKSKSRIRFLPPREDDPARRRPDITKARERLGWEPGTPLEDGLARTIDDIRRRLEEGEPEV
jgi:dTDP-glucose 4,6-dehydratase